MVLASSLGGQAGHAIAAPLLLPGVLDPAAPRLVRTRLASPRSAG
jgi:hypothetical protein